VRLLLWLFRIEILIFASGELVATHRKVHLFDIDIPGKFKFKVTYIHNLFFYFSLTPVQESETLTGGSTTNFFDTGKASLHPCPIRS
jgi:predicted amidohydrolase